MIKIKQTRPYYDSSSFLANLFNQTGDNFYDDGVLKMKLVNETLFMNKNCWYHFSASLFVDAQENLNYIFEVSNCELLLI